MALHGSAGNNLCPVLHKGNNKVLGINVILHKSETSLNTENLYGEPVVCISVIDESNQNTTETVIRSDWLNFRSSYPNRPFFLLQPLGTTTSGSGKNNSIDDLKIPVEFNSDALATYSVVNRDNGSVFSASDWFSICGLSTYPANTLVSLFIDTSGSMDLDTVRASYNKFLDDCSNNDIVIAGNSQNQSERWSLDHIKTFSELIDLITVTRTLDESQQFYNDGDFIESLQNSLLDKKIGSDINGFPNLYAYMGQKGRNALGTFNISNPNGSLTISNSFLRGDSTGILTKNSWLNYYANINSHTINVCTDVVGSTVGGRLEDPDSNGLNSADSHGNLWSIFTTPNAISTQIPGFFGSVISSNIRKGCETLVITDSNEQIDSPLDLIGENINVGGLRERKINDDGTTIGELNFRKYKVIALSGYSSTDNYDGVLFYGSGYTNPYGYVTLSGIGTNDYSITKSSTPPNWTNTINQKQDMLTLAQQTKGALFKSSNVYGQNDYRKPFCEVISIFVKETLV